MVRKPTSIWRLRCLRTSANTGSMLVATRTTARTLWSAPWHPWHFSWFSTGRCTVKNVVPSRCSSDSWVWSVSTARVKSGPVMAGPAGRAILEMESNTPFSSPAFFSTSWSVTRSVKASTPLRR